MEDSKQPKSEATQSRSPSDPAEVLRAQANWQADAAAKYTAAEKQTFDFGNNTPAYTSRSEAQREASRRNGARSRGPVTAEGKAKSAANAMKHGLLARFISPPGDVREHDKLYRRIRQELIDELQPSTFSEWFVVALLAHDILQRVRAGEMLEALQRPMGINSKDAEDYHQMKVDRRLMKRIISVIAELDAKEAPGCKPKFAELIAGRVGDYVEMAEADVAPSADSIPEDEMDEDQREDDRLRKQEWVMLQPVKVKLTDRQYVAAVLAGQVTGTPAMLKELRHVLDQLVSIDRGRLKPTREALRKVELACQQQVTRLTNEPEKLMLLHRHANGIERSIWRKLNQLR